MRKGSIIVCMVLTRFAERQVDATSAHQRMVSFLQRQHAMVAQPGGSAPNHYVAVRQFDAQRFVGSFESREEENGGNSQGYGNNWLGKVLLIFILMQRHFCARLVAIN